MILLNKRDFLKQEGQLLIVDLICKVLQTIGSHPDPTL